MMIAIPFSFRQYYNSVLIRKGYQVHVITLRTLKQKQFSFLIKT